MTILFLIGVSFPLIYGCKKFISNETKNFVFNTEIAAKWFNDSIITKGKNRTNQVVSDQSEFFKKRIFARMQKISRNVDWTNATQFNFDGDEYLIIPIKGSLKPFKNKNFEASRTLVFEKNKLGSIQMNIVETFHANKTLNATKPDELIQSIISKKEALNNTNASSQAISILFYNIDYELQDSYTFKNGIYSKSKIELQNVAVATDQNSNINKNRDPIITCQTFYLIGYWYEIGTGNIIGWEIIDQWQECSPSGGGDEEDGGGYGDGGGPPSNDCMNTAVTQLSELSNAFVTNETMGFDIQNLSNTGINNLPTKSKNPFWQILKSYGGWTLLSFERGVIKLVEIGSSQSQDKWEWVSLEHDRVTLVGIPLGGTVQPDNGSGTSHVYSLYAGMELDFTVKYTVTVPFCEALPLVTYSIPYHSISPFWNSNPY